MRKSPILPLVNTWWRPGLAILLAILAQGMLSTDHLWPGLGLYVIAIGLWLCNKSMHPLGLAKTDEIASDIQAGKLSRLQKGLLNLSIFATYVNIGATLGYDRLTWIGVIAWGVSVGAFIVTF